ESYFAAAEGMTLGVMIVDCRHKPTGDDVTMANWFKNAGRDFVIVANNLDKVKKSELDGNLAQIRQTLELDAQVEIIPFSAEKGTNREALAARIDACV
ncbi:MAG: YihA family ribosome biogenesis GTP-binding protein, partial [Oscillospiraceae bacterium]|nr:YihA family ribosome biogenesis GTP-binding protein [Oscillospiraceae bacterium]